MEIITKKFLDKQRKIDYIVDGRQIAFYGNYNEKKRLTKKRNGVILCMDGRSCFMEIIAKKKA